MARRLAGYITWLLLNLLWLGHSSNGEISAQKALFDHGSPHGDDEVRDVNNGIFLDLPFNVSYIGFKYRKLWVSSDGTVSFENGVNYNDKIQYFGGVRSPSVDVPFIAPLLYRSYYIPTEMSPSIYQGKISYRFLDFTSSQVNSSQENKVLREHLEHYLSEALINSSDHWRVTFVVVITWDNLAEETPEIRECSQTDPCNSTTFQLLLAGNDVDTVAIFNYEKYSITESKQYEAGFNAGRGRGWYNVLPCHSGCDKYTKVPTVSNLPNYRGSDVQGRYIFSVGQETVIRGGCLDPELTAGILETYPRTVGMFGGEKLEVSGLCGAPKTKIYCRFGAAKDRGSRVVEGAMINSMKGYCPVPLLSTTGSLDVYWSNDTKLWTADRSIIVVLPSVLKSSLVVNEQEQAAWYKRSQTDIFVRWAPASFSRNTSASVDVKLFGYKESENEVEYKELKNFGSIQNSKGVHTIPVQQYHCTANCEEFEIGLLEVSLSPQYHTWSTGRLAVRYGPIPLGWYVNEHLERARGSDWSNQKCKEWYDSDKRNREWLKDLLPCPCSLDQALADFGRWQADPGCNLFTGSVCRYHKGAKHCVRSVVPTKDGAGNQCCYNPDGTLKHSQLSHEGSTPDRSHVWGASPYNVPDRVPELSHWKHDVISFYYCCLWNNYDLCDLYTELRPTRDCRDYDVPGIGSIHGHTHVTTFDGLEYHFTGSGDYWLAQYEAESFHVQGKFQPRDQSWDLGKNLKKSSWKPKVLTALALSSGRKRIEVSLAPSGVSQRRALDIRVDKELRYFEDKITAWQDFQEFAAINNNPITSNHNNPITSNHNNFTFILYNSNVGVNVVAINGLLHVIVAVPPRYKDKVTGLLGRYDDDPENDFYSRLNKIVSRGLNKTIIFKQFVQSWNVTKKDFNIFMFSNIEEAVVPDFLYFESSQIPTNFTGAPRPEEENQVCGNHENCKYDFRITGDEVIARATKDADVWLASLRRSAQRLDSCGLPEVGHAVLSSEDFRVGREVKVTSCTDGRSVGGNVTFRCLNESLDAVTQNGRADYGTRRTKVSNKQDYIVYWDPKPQPVCSLAGNEDGASLDLGLIIGPVVGAVVLIAIVVVIIVVIVEKRKSGKASPSEGRTAAPRGKKGVESDPAAAEAMLSRVEDRSPVYKPSKEQVRMSELPGSNA